jgi:hypothetical protein
VVETVVLALLIGVSPPTILSRKEWGAKPPVLSMDLHEPKYLTIHHAGVRTKEGISNIQKLRNLQAWCQRKDMLASGKEKPAWPDIPYHYYIFRDGQVAECRDWRFVGDTNTEYDPTGHLLICLEGDFEAEQPSHEQLASLTQTANWLLREHRLLRISIGAHLDYAKTSCPGKNLLPYVRKLKQEL